MAGGHDEAGDERDAPEGHEQAKDAVVQGQLVKQGARLRSLG
jgi:hypothetical protein